MMATEHEERKEGLTENQAVHSAAKVIGAKVKVFDNFVCSHFN